MSEGKTCQFASEIRPDYRCFHPPWEGDRKGLCIFHSPLVEDKKKPFKTKLNKYIKRVEENDEINGYDFRGFIFPEIDFREKEFVKKAFFFESPFSGLADFTGSEFSGDAHFNQSRFFGDAHFNQSRFSGLAGFGASEFLGNAVFTKSRFSGPAFFNSSLFSGPADFESSRFSGDADFRSSTFSEPADFTKSRFSKLADFRSSTFSGSANFRSSQFSRDADFFSSKFSKKADFTESTFSGAVDFYRSQFSGPADFTESKFLGRLNLKDTRFKNDLDFQKASFDYLKDLETNKTNLLNFSGAILEESHFYDILKLENIGFQGAFLLSLSLAEKRIINCDFTGATFDAVRTRGWKPDQQTIDNTKYIYTDYTVETVLDENGKERKVHKAVDDSRVPADGFFGEGDNKDFTIEDFLFEPYIWSRSIHIPTELQSEFKNYILFFQEFIYATEGIQIEIVIRKEGKRLRIEFHTSNLEEKKSIESHFKSYMLRINEENQAVEFNNPNLSKEQQILTIARLENRIAQLLNDTRNAERIIGLQAERIRFMENLAINYSRKKDRPITVVVDARSKSSSESNPTISVDTTVSIQLSELRNQFEELERGLEDGSQEKQAAKDLAKDVDSIREYTSKEELKKSPVMRKLKDFLKGIGKAGELANSIAAKVDGGTEKVRKIAETYNKLAETCGFDPINIFLG